MQKPWRRRPRDVPYFTGLYVATLRWLLTAGAPGHRPITHRSRDPLDSLLTALFGLSIAALPMVHATTTLLDRWSYPVPRPLRRVGSTAFALALALMWKAYRDLGANWAPIPDTDSSQTLITSGVYGFIRHPIYAAYLTWSASMPLMVPNFVAGLAMPLVTILLSLYRIPGEERRLLKAYGDAYRRYCRSTGRLLPRHFPPARHLDTGASAAPFHPLPGNGKGGTRVTPTSQTVDR